MSEPGLRSALPLSWPTYRIRAGSLPRGQTSGALSGSKTTPGLLAQLRTPTTIATRMSGRRYLIQRRILKLPLDPDFQELKHVVLIARVQCRIPAANINRRL